MFKGCETRVGNSHPVGISGQVLEDVLRLLNGLPDTDDPVVFIEGVFERLICSIDTEFSVTDCLSEVMDELAAKDH